VLAVQQALGLERRSAGASVRVPAERGAKALAPARSLATI
jgi:hypothetical protein